MESARLSSQMDAYLQWRQEIHRELTRYRGWLIDHNVQNAELEAKLEQFPGQLTRACVELAKDWRTDRYLRRLEAMMAVADKEGSLVLTGTGDVLEPEDGLIGIGSGGNYALAAARALIDRDDMDARQIAEKAMGVAAEICVYTNNNFVIEKL